MTKIIEMKTDIAENAMKALIEARLRNAEPGELNRLGNKACIATKELFVARTEELYGEPSMPETKMKEYVSRFPLRPDTITEEFYENMMSSFECWTRELGRKDTDLEDLEMDYRKLLSLIARTRKA